MTVTHAILRANNGYIVKHNRKTHITYNKQQKEMKQKNYICKIEKSTSVAS